MNAMMRTSVALKTTVAVAETKPSASVAIEPANAESRAVEVGHVHGDAEPLEALLEPDDLARRSVAVLGGPRHEVVQLRDEARHDEREDAREHEGDADVHDHDGKSPVQRGALVDPRNERAEQVREQPGREEDEQDVGDASERAPKVGDDLERDEDDEQHDERGEKLPIARREVHVGMVMTGLPSPTCRADH